jgi:hypothetical protein
MVMLGHRIPIIDVRKPLHSLIKKSINSPPRWINTRAIESNIEAVSYEDGCPSGNRNSDYSLIQTRKALPLARSSYQTYNQNPKIALSKKIAFNGTHSE